MTAAREALLSAQLAYGGGIHDYDSAHKMARVVDTVIVGDVLHDPGIEAVEETVRGATDAQHKS